MIRSRRLMKTAFVAVSVFFAIFAPVLRNRLVAQSEQETKKNILQAWAKRQNRTETALFEWEQTNRMRLSNLLPKVIDHIRKEIPDVGDFVAVEQPSSLRLDKDKFDYRLDTIDSAKFRMPAGLRCSYDGKRSQNYSGTSLPGSVGSGIVQGDPHAFGTTMLYARPLLFHYRPLHHTMAHIDFEKYRVRPGKVPIGNHLCILLEEVEDKPLRVRFWLDPDNEFLLRRYEEVVEGQAVQRLDVSYVQDVHEGLVPSEWTTTIITTGTDELNSTAKCKVRNYRINKFIPLSDFRIEYPAGTLVTDRVTGSTYREGESQSVVKHWFLSIVILLSTIAFLLLFLRWRSSSRNGQRRQMDQPIDDRDCDEEC